MSLKDALAKAREDRPEPVRQPVAVGDELFEVEMKRLDGMAWAAITSECPPTDAMGAGLGYDSNRAALLACKRHGRLLDADGEPVDMSPVRDEHGNIISEPWEDVFTAISGAEVSGIAAIWWMLNMLGPNERVAALKKASAGGSATS